MNLVSNPVLVLLVSCAGFVACGGSQTPLNEPTPVGAEVGKEPAAGAGEGSARPSITAEACEGNGGSVVGDIGDGAIHRPDYRCVNGAKPTANIRSADGEPIAIEGSVCCPK